MYYTIPQNKTHTNTLNIVRVSTLPKVQTNYKLLIYHNSLYFKYVREKSYQLTTSTPKIYVLVLTTPEPRVQRR